MLQEQVGKLVFVSEKTANCGVVAITVLTGTKCREHILSALTSLLGLQ